MRSTTCCISCLTKATRRPAPRPPFAPIYQLNRAVVVAEIDGPEAGIRALEEAGRDPALRRYHLFDATLGEFHRRIGDLACARKYLETARQKTNSPFDHELIDRRLQQ